MSLAERLKAMLIERGYSQGELARRVGVTQGTIYKLASGHAKSSKRIVEIAQSLGVRAEWLLTGNGPQYITEPGKDNPLSGQEELTADPEGLQIIDFALPYRDGEIAVPLLPDIDSAFASSPFPFTEYNGPVMRIEKDVLTDFGVNVTAANFVAFFVTGDNMDPVMPEGTQILVDMNDKRIVDGKMYALDQSSWRKVRLLYRSGPSELTLKSYNSQSFPDEKIPMGEVDILGRIVYLQRNV